ncbi:MAG: hypothetical protein J5793_03720, partial [Clostridia bacterium]|nr:hypothetical protein [Clostridia bacterium]
MKNTPRRLFTAVLALTTALIFFLPTGSFTATANDRQAEKSIIVIGDVSSMFSGWEEIFENDSGETLLVLSSPDMNSESAKETARERIGIGSTVFIALGTNDAMLGTGTYVKYERFKDNLRLIVDICRDANAVPIIVTPPPIYDESFFGEESGEEYGIYGGANGFVTNYACLAREAAREKCVCIADMNAAFWDVNFKNYIGGDGVTLNEKGAELYARTSLDAYRTATLGDPSFDGRVGATDYLLIKRSTLGTYEMTQAQTARSDADGDGKIDAVDYLMVKRHVLDTYHIDRGEHSAEITYRESVFQGT